MARIVDSDTQADGAAPESRRASRRLPKWMITLGSVTFLVAAWEWFGRDINPVFGSYPSAIVAAFVELAASGKLAAAMSESLRPFVAGYLLAILCGVPLGLIIGRYRA